jgi:hypothetical protein
MSDKKISLGQAIDTIIQALETLEPSAQKTAINAACEHLGIENGGGKQTVLPPPPFNSVNNNPDSIAGSKQIDIRTLKEQKTPRTAAQMACVVAYYMQELAPLPERKQSINANDLDKYFKQAKFKIPKSFPQLLVDSKIAGYFDSPSKGEYSLNAVGYNLVVHNLPKASN